jgi:hypothetical protein
MLALDPAMEVSLCLFLLEQRAMTSSNDEYLFIILRTMTLGNEELPLKNSKKMFE